MIGSHGLEDEIENDRLLAAILDGAAMCRSDGIPVIALILRHDRLDNFWFTLFHEFAHVVRHLSPDRQLKLDDLDVASSETIEAEADAFARNALIPPTIWKQIVEDSSTEEIIDAAEKAGVHPAIAAGRWRFEHSDYRRFSKLIGRGAFSNPPRDCRARCFRRSTIGRQIVFRSVSGYRVVNQSVGLKLLDRGGKACSALSCGSEIDLSLGSIIP
ncbi:ImmA/IrrE family metallo-endopeptidase [Bradyrhizobium sp. CB82]|uniref:ImmA/IrrE family metallo-endopeptidase n=1 Tax=Bradyrhizobium sp. CB82 TaxID=3039159 RepID=UPI0024B0894F|nr:ImmA/IrrE family metallo-endopeptidase [Bradyrhizobium sp. CB82]WFU40360.1 ImmA/IrrE family metallo-endopeptidase [Bradyrhizobium sp. CB82]